MSTEIKIENQRKELLKYTSTMVLPSDDLMKLKSDEKLILCQITPESVLKDWPFKDSKNKPIKYVPIWYIERCLNFVSMFDWGCEVKREWMTEYSYTKSDWSKTTVYDARVLAHFYIQLWDKRIERSCYWSWKIYSNQATSRFTVYEAARSMATKSFADTLWIASDKLSKEFDDIRKADEQKVIDWDIADKKPAIDSLRAWLKRNWLTTEVEANKYLSEIMNREIKIKWISDEDAKIVYDTILRIKKEKEDAK